MRLRNWNGRKKIKTTSKNLQTLEDFSPDCWLIYFQARPGDGPHQADAAAYAKGKNTPTWYASGRNVKQSAHSTARRRPPPQCGDFHCSNMRHFHEDFHFVKCDANDRRAQPAGKNEEQMIVMNMLSLPTQRAALHRINSRQWPSQVKNYGAGFTVSDVISHPDCRELTWRRLIYLERVNTCHPLLLWATTCGPSADTDRQQWQLNARDQHTGVLSRKTYWFEKCFIQSLGHREHSHKTVGN